MAEHWTRITLTFERLAEWPDGMPPAPEPDSLSLDNAKSLIVEKMFK